jgi:hypothetical protein
LHLDTSDYSAMYHAAPGTPPARVRDKLRELAQSRRIEIGLSYHVVFELLQKGEPRFREDRLARAPRPPSEWPVKLRKRRLKIGSGNACYRNQSPSR